MDKESNSVEEESTSSGRKYFQFAAFHCLQTEKQGKYLLSTIEGQVLFSDNDEEHLKNRSSL